MFEFAVRTTIGRYDLETAEGRIQAMRAAAPIVAGIRDQSLRPEYARVLAGLLGVEVEQVTAEVARAGKAGKAGSRPAYETRRHPEPTEAQLEPTADELRDALPRPDLRDPVVIAERQLLQVVLQQPESARTRLSWTGSTARRSARRRTGRSGTPSSPPGARAGRPPPGPTPSSAAAPAAVQPLVAELAVAPLPVTPDRATGLPSRRYAASLVTRLREVGLTRQIADALSQLRRRDRAPEPDAVGAARAGPAAAGAPARAGRSAGTSRRADAVVDQGATLRGPPDDVVAALRGADGGKVLSAAPEADSRAWLVASTYHLALVDPGRPAGETLVWSRPWHEVDSGSWSREASTLTVSWADRSRPGQWRLGEGMRERVFLQTLRERVQASVVLGEELSAERAPDRARRDPPGPAHRRPRRAGRPRAWGPRGRGGRPPRRPARWRGCASRSGCRSRSRRCIWRTDVASSSAGGRAAGRFRDPVSRLLTLPAHVPNDAVPHSSIGRAADC